VSALAAEDKREMAERLERDLRAFLEEGKPMGDAHAREWLFELSKEPGLESLRKFADPNAPQNSDFQSLERVVTHTRDGSITKITGTEMLLAVSALSELSRLAGAVDNALSRRLKGRTIRATIGTSAEAFVAEDVTVKVSSPVASR
jgi:hypothetical protein